MNDTQERLFNLTIKTENQEADSTCLLRKSGLDSQTIYQAVRQLEAERRLMVERYIGGYYAVTITAYGRDMYYNNKGRPQENLAQQDANRLLELLATTGKDDEAWSETLREHSMLSQLRFDRAVEHLEYVGRIRKVRVRLGGGFDIELMS